MRGITWEAPQDAIFICLEERDIHQFELNGLLLGALCAVTLTFDCVLADAQEVINAIRAKSPTACDWIEPDLP